MSIFIGEIDGAVQSSNQFRMQDHAKVDSKEEQTEIEQLEQHPKAEKPVKRRKE